MSDCYRQAEKMLYSFPINMMRLNECLLKLSDLRSQTDCHAQSYENIMQDTGTPNEPVYKYYIEIEKLELHIKTLIKRTKPLIELRNEIKNSQDERLIEIYYVMEMYYFEKWSMNDIAFHLQKSLKTLQRRRHELVELVIKAMKKE